MMIALSEVVNRDFAFPRYSIKQLMKRPGDCALIKKLAAS
jgi:hypothetical protein